MQPNKPAQIQEKIALLLSGFAAIAAAIGVAVVTRQTAGTLVLTLVTSLLAVAGLLGIQAARKLPNDVLKYAFNDELTGLPNRRFFMERLWTALSGPRRSRKLALFLLDLDRFKVINDTLGHPAGDELLIAVARTLARNVREEDVLARLGGDEFAVLADVEDEEEATQLAGRLLSALNARVYIRAQEVWPNASIGIAMPGPTRPQPQELLSMADVALYQAKAKGKGQYSLFESQAALPSVHRLSLESELRAALAEGQFEMVYQPLVDLHDMRIAGVEALLRWNHPTLGLMSPDSFLSLAEETGLLRPLSEWVLTEVCTQAKGWQDLFGDLSVSVNLSAIQFRDLGFVTELGRVLRKTGADSSTVLFEITESALMQDEEDTLRNLDELRSLGFKVAIDDFGVGYSSLSYLRRFKVDILKIDQSFVQDEDCERTLAIVRSVVALAHALGMYTTAEGIETDEQLQRMREAGCDFAQGYFLSRPVSAAEVTEILSAGEVTALFDGGLSVKPRWLPPPLPEEERRRTLIPARWSRTHGA